MRLSIITINYNNVEGLRRTIDSVLMQTWTDFEWIVIDGGSTDGSRELIEQNASHFAYWSSEPDRGIYNAMNKGVLKAGGEYLNFLNSGDVFCESGTLSRVFNGNATADVLYGDVLLRDGQGEIVGRLSPPPKITIVGYLNGVCIPHQASFIRKERMLSHLYDERFRVYADMEFFAYILSLGAKFEKINFPIAVFQLGGVSDKRNFRLPIEDKRARLSGLGHLFSAWFKFAYWIIPSIPIRPKWALIRLLCYFTVRKSELPDSIDEKLLWNWNFSECL